MKVKRRIIKRFRLELGREKKMEKHKKITLKT